MPLSYWLGGVFYSEVYKVARGYQVLGLWTSLLGGVGGRSSQRPLRSQRIVCRASERGMCWPHRQVLDRQVLVSLLALSSGVTSANYFPPSGFSSSD
jgi:hypothetical protein